MNARKGLDTRRSVIIAILFGALVATAFGAAGCGDQMARMQQNQVKLQAMVAANARELATLSSQVHVSQDRIEEGFAGLEQDIRNTDARLAAVQSEQAQLHQTVAANDQNMNARLTQLTDNQASLRDGIAHVADIAQRTNTTVSTVARDQATLHQLVQNNKKELGESITTVANNQEQTHAGIHQLHQADQNLANLIATVTAKQEALQKLTEGNHEQLTGSLAALSTHQGQFRGEMGDLRSLTQTVAADVTALGNEQAALHDTVRANTATLVAGQGAIRDTLRTNNEVVAAGLTNLAVQQQDIGNNVTNLRENSDKLAADLATVASEQTALRQMVSNSTENLAAIAEGQGALQLSVGALDAKTTTLASDISSVSQQLSALDENVKAGNETLTSHTAALADGQRMIQTGLNTMTATTNQSALTVLAMGNRQGEMEQAMQAGIDRLTVETQQLASGQQTLDAALRDRSESLSSQLVNLTQKQQQMQSGLDTLTMTTGQVALDVLAIHDTQAGQGQAIASNQQQLVAKLDATAQNQQQIREGLDTITATTTQTALDVLTVSETQAGQAQAIQANQQQLVARLDATAQNQQQIREGLDTITATTTQTALDVLTVSEIQAGQTQTIEANQHQLVARLDATAQNQQQIRDGLDTITTTTTQTALDVLTVSEVQAGQTQTIQANQQQVVARLDAAAQDQQQIRDSLGTIGATTAQVALDVLAGHDSQVQQAQTLQAGQQAIAAELSTVTEGQQQVQGHLETITATATQVARDVVQVGENQGKLERAFETNRQELVARLTEIAQGQQEWLTRFDAAQANIEAMATGIASLEQRVMKLQGTLQSSLNDLNTLLDAKSQRQAQFEETVRQDVQSLGDSLVQLRDAQTGLQKRIQEMQSSSESQTEDLLSAIEQLQQKTDSNSALVPAEIKSSKAQPEQIPLP